MYFGIRFMATCTIQITMMPLSFSLISTKGRQSVILNCDAFINTTDRESVNLNGHIAFITARGRQSADLNAKCDAYISARDRESDCV